MQKPYARPGRVAVRWSNICEKTTRFSWHSYTASTRIVAKLSRTSSFWTGTGEALRAQILRSGDGNLVAYCVQNVQPDAQRFHLGQVFRSFSTRLLFQNLMIPCMLNGVKLSGTNSRDFRSLVYIMVECGRNEHQKVSEKAICKGIILKNSTLEVMKARANEVFQKRIRAVDLTISLTSSYFTTERIYERNIASSSKPAEAIATRLLKLGNNTT